MSAAPVYFTCTLGQAVLYRTADKFTNINDFIQDTADTVPHAPAVGFCHPAGPDVSEQWGHTVLSFAEVLQGSYATAQIISERISIPERETVALLCPSTVEFLFTWLALMRLGHPVLLIAPQCSASAVASLSQQCNVRYIFYDDMYLDLAQEAVKHTEAAEWRLKHHLLPFAVGGLDPYSLARRPQQRIPRASPVGSDDVAYLHHTSGTSSGIPKPIPQTHFAGAGACPRLDGSGHATFTTTPLYHGGIADLFRAWTSNALIWLFPGKGAPITATNIIKCLEIARTADTPPVAYFSSVPYVLEMMASDDRGLQHLQAMDIVAVGGAALTSEVGDRLVKQGVNLTSRFGSAECGFLMSSHREYERDQAWDFLRAHGELSFEPREGGLYELVVPPSWPHISKTDKVGDDGSFATCDLFRPHASIPNAWRYDSRADSQLTLVTGKKFDPAPLEDAIAAKSISIQDVLIFGEGKPYPGALLFRSAHAADKSDDELLNEIGPQVEKLNRGSQQHARIPSSTLLMMPYIDTPLQKSSKGTVMRKLAEEQYASEIKAAYEGSSSGGSSIADGEVESFVLDAVRAVMSSSDRPSAPLQTDTDLFAYGIDSVASVQIRHAVSRLLPETSGRLPLTIVQDTGSVRKLSQALIDLRHDRKVPQAGMEDPAELMRGLVQQYSSLNSVSNPGSSDLPTPPPTPAWQKHTPGKIVLLTGPTGSLGSQLLGQLIKSPDVSRIHLLLRGASRYAAEERVRKALCSRRISISAKDYPKIKVHTCSLSDPHLGLSAQTYTELAQEVDLIYHMAWAVDFILPLPGFRQHFAGLQALLSLALAHSKWTALCGRPIPAKLIFCSSTASVASYDRIHPGIEVPEEIVNHTTSSGSIGYSRSKWVAENICSQAVMAHPELRGAVSVVRVGQLSGDSVHGVWNKSEAYPLMISSAKVTGCLPALPQESVGWFPVDLAAEAFVELGMSGLEMASKSVVGDVRVVHVLNQCSTPTWRELLEWLSKEGSFEVVEPSEWLTRLEALSRSESEGKTQHACLKLLEFWKSAYGSLPADDALQRKLTYKTAESLKSMPVLRSVKPVDEEYARKLWRWIAENN